MNIRLQDSLISPAFGGAVAAAAVWSIWGGDMFPAEPDPTGKPDGWTRDDMRRWLAAVSWPPFSQLERVVSLKLAFQETCHS